MDDSDLLAPFRARIEPRTTRLPPAQDAGEEEASDEIIAPGQAYSSVRGPRRANALKFVRLDRISFAMPYALLPIVWPASPALLLLEYPHFFTVALRGKGLDAIEDRIIDHRLFRVRECRDDEAAALSVAVTGIDILASYPSRDMADERPGNGS